MAEDAMTAWVDESIQQLGDQDGHVYLLGAVLMDSRGAARLQSELLSRAPTHRKLHWRDLGSRGRRDVDRWLRGWPGEALVAVEEGAAPSGLERARALCMKRLLGELARLGVPEVHLESRSRAQDVTDRRRIDGMRSQQLIPDTMMVTWDRGAEAPLLWAADLLLGSLGVEMRERRRLSDRDPYPVRVLSSG